jgi:hypothetical protein
MLNLVVGVAMLLASVIAGMLWDLVGADATFMAGAAFAVISLIGLFRLREQFGIAAAPVRTS